MLTPVNNVALKITRWVALMIQHGKFVGGVEWVGGRWLTPTTYIQLAGAGSMIKMT